MSTIHFKSVDLWGGNMKVQLPSNFVDASHIREVPSHQEVWLDGEGLANIIISLNQMVEVSSDEDALKFHLEDQVEDDTYRIWANQPIVAERFPSTTRGRFLVATVMNPKKTDIDFYAVILLMFRLREYETDIITTITIPHPKGQYDTKRINLEEGKLGPLMETAQTVKDAIAHSLECPDFSFLVRQGNGDEDEVMSD